MKLTHYFVFSALLIYASTNNLLFANEVGNVIARNCSVKGKVLELTLPANFEGQRLLIGFSKDGQTHGTNLIVRAGKHYYDLRGHEEWNGTIEVVASNLPKNIKGHLVESSLMAELDIFLAPNALTPTTINLVWQKTLLGIPWTVWLFAIAVFSALICFFFAKKNFPIALIVGCVVAFVIMNVRTMYDHYRVLVSVENTHPYVAPLKNAQRMGDEWSAISRSRLGKK